MYFKLKKGANYYIDINVLDNHKKTIYSHNLFTNKESINSRQNFLVYNPRQEVLFNSYYKPDDVVYLQSFRNKEKLYEVDYFKSKFKLALPPFSTEQMQRFSYKPDSTFSVYEKNGLIEYVFDDRINYDDVEVDYDFIVDIKYIQDYFK